MVRQPPTAGRAPLLVVGVGSELRSDDAVGRRVVESIGRRRSSDRLEVRSVHQLTPELAEALTDRQLVIVVDACVGVTELVVADVASTPVAAASTPVAGPSTSVAGPLTHHLDVAALVRLADMLGRPPARVVTVGVPAFDLGLGTILSPQTSAALDAAVDVILSLCDGTVPAGHATEEPCRDGVASNDG